MQRHRRFKIEPLERRELLTGDPIISEFAAINDGSLADEDGDFSDWIEIYNPDTESVDLSGWYLSDDSVDLDKWQFPAVSIDAGGYLVVFASQKDRTVAGAPLHTNFKLDGGGEYLALVHPDQISIASEFAPEFPKQHEGVTYGLDLANNATMLVSAGDQARILIPTAADDAAIGTTWTGSSAFDDSSWIAGATGIGFGATTVGGGNNGGGNLGDPQIALNITAGTVGNQSFGGALGMDFTLGGPITISELGVFDDSSNGLSRTITVELWSRNDGQTPADPSDDTGGGILASLVFTPTDDGTLDGGSRFKPLAQPLQLAAGDYTIVAHGYGTIERNGNASLGVAASTVAETGGVLSFVGVSRYGTAGDFPNTPDQGPANRYGAGTFRFSLGTAADVPAAPVAASAVATGIAYDIVAGTPGNQDYGGSLGMDFYVVEPVTITDLGVFDDNSNGLGRTLTVELWSRDDNNTPSFADDSGVAIIASSEFTPTGAGTLDGGSRFKPLPQPVTLSPGAYTISAYGYGAGERNGNGGATGSAFGRLDAAGGAIRYEGTSRFGGAGAFPTNVDGGPEFRYGAGTFKFANASLLLKTDIGEQMQGVNASAYIRIPFQAGDPSSFERLRLHVNYDDGFIAYLNGTEIARRNAPLALSWDAAAAAPREPFAVFSRETIDVSSYLSLLQPGAENLLVLQVMSAGIDDQNLLILPELEAIELLGLSPRFYDTPTPGQPNSSSFLDFVSDTTFSIDRGFFGLEDLDEFGEMRVEITSTTANAQIRYTTDGSEPSANNGTLVDGPITISGTTTLRAIALKDGYRPTNVDTQTYIFLDDVLAQSGTPTGFPSSWGGTVADWDVTQNASDRALIAGDAGLSAEEADAIIKDSLRSLPTMSIVMDIGDLFGPSGIYSNPGARGPAWERPASIEYILADGTSAFQINAGLQIMGGSSRSPSETPKHSMRILFKKQYGEGRLNYPFFGEQGAGSFNTIGLRSNARDTWLASSSDWRSTASYIADQWAKQAQAAMGTAATDGNFVQLYLNGQYWGLYNPTERPDAAFSASRFGGADEDYDTVKFCCPDRAVDGDISKWDQALALASAGLGSDEAYQRIAGNNPDGTRNPQYDVLIDVDNLIDYIINGQYHAAGDWPGNYYATREKGSDSTGFRFFTWDNDLGFPGGNVNANKVQGGNNNWWTESPGVFDLALRANAEYRLRFADHVQQHLFNDGSLTPQAAADLWRSIAAEVEQPLIAEAVRWGDYRRSTPFTPQVDWQAVNDQMLNNYFPARTQALLSQLRSAGLYPSIDAPAYNQHGGTITPGFELSMTTPGDVYYTLDGSDPRLPGGAINPNAMRFDGGTPITLSESALLSSRALLGGTWSALNQALFTVDSPLRVTEVMYNPSGTSDTEFVELMNVSDSVTLDLEGIRFDDGIEFTFPKVQLAPNERIVVVADQTAFVDRYGAGAATIAGTFNLSLSNSGERLLLVDTVGGTIQDFRYDDAWYPATDGDGFSLVIVDPVGEKENWNEAPGWRSSFVTGGSPGRADQLSGDINADGRVDIQDIAVLQSQSPVVDRSQVVAVLRSLVPTSTFGPSPAAQAEPILVAVVPTATSHETRQRLRSSRSRTSPDSLRMRTVIQDRAIADLYSNRTLEKSSARRVAVRHRVPTRSAEQEEMPF